MTKDIADKLRRGGNLTSDELRRVASYMSDSLEGDSKDLLIAQLCARVAELLDDVANVDRRTAHMVIPGIGTSRR